MLSFLHVRVVSMSNRKLFCNYNINLYDENTNEGACVDAYTTHLIVFRILLRKSIAEILQG